MTDLLHKLWALSIYTLSFNYLWHLVLQAFPAANMYVWCLHVQLMDSGVPIYYQNNHTNMRYEEFNESTPFIAQPGYTSVLCYSVFDCLICHSQKSLTFLGMCKVGFVGSDVWGQQMTLKSSSPVARFVSVLMTSSGLTWMIIIFNLLSIKADI